MSSTRNGPLNGLLNALLNGLLNGLFHGRFPFSVVSSVSSHLVSSRLVSTPGSLPPLPSYSVPLVYLLSARIDADAVDCGLGRPLILVDSSCTSWTTRFDVGQPLYGIVSFCFSIISQRISCVHCTITIYPPTLCAPRSHNPHSIVYVPCTFTLQ